MIRIPASARLGNLVIEAKHVSKAFGDHVLFADLSFLLPGNGITGISASRRCRSTAFSGATVLTSR